MRAQEFKLELIISFHLFDQKKKKERKKREVETRVGGAKVIPQT